MFKAKGKLAILADNKEREITVDNGKITGDEIFEFEIKYILNRLAKKNKPVGAANYTPKTEDYTKDSLAVLLVIRDICSVVAFEGDTPTLPYEEGVEY